MKRFVAAALAATTFATPAFAQDAATFTGPRVEAVIGYDVVGIPGISDPDGFAYGVGLGYDFAAGGVILGVEAEISDSETKVTDAVGDTLETDRDIYVGGRIGTVIGQSLLYAKAGYTNARFEADGIGGANADGIRLGAGVEYALGNNLFLKGEYRYSNYEADISRNQVVAGFGFRF
jgi:outer membrane immunogenic protein